GSVGGAARHVEQTKTKSDASSAIRFMGNSYSGTRNKATPKKDCGAWNCQPGFWSLGSWIPAPRCPVNSCLFPLLAGEFVQLGSQFLGGLARFDFVSEQDIGHGRCLPVISDIGALIGRNRAGFQAGATIKPLAVTEYQHGRLSG